MNSYSRRVLAVLGLIVALLVPAGCGSSAPAPPAPVSGLFDAGGHSLYVECSGSGGPTIIYLHGAIPSKERVPLPHANGFPIRDKLNGDYRVCVYDRRNVGQSETVDASQSPQDAINDLRAAMSAAGEKPPYALLGASFGGLLSYVYANTFPDEVIGMVLLDSPFPDEMSLEHLFPLEDRYEGSHEDDLNKSLERISHYDVMILANDFIGKEPAIPVVYFASKQEPRNVNDWGVKKYNEEILGLQTGFVERFSPGKEIWVDSPHFMEPVIPQEIADALREVIRSAGR